MNRYLSKSSSETGRTVFLLVFFTFSAILMLLLCLWAFTANNIWLYLSIYFVLIYAFFLKGKHSLFSIPTLFCIFFSYMIGLGPVIAHFRDWKPHPSVMQLILGSFGLILFGYILPIRKNSISNNVIKDNYSIIWSFNTVLLLISTVASTLYAWSVNSFDMSLAASRIVALSGQGTLIYISNFWVFASCLLYELQLKGYRKIGLLWIPILICIITKILSGFQSSFLVFFVMLILIRNKKEKMKPFFILAFGCAVLLFVPFYQIFRGDYSSAQGILPSIFLTPFASVINLTHVLNAFPNAIPYQYGYTYLINFIMLRPGPDPDFTLWLKDALNMQFVGGGVTPTIIGEAYLNFGYTGIIIQMFLFGLILKRVNLYYINSKNYFLPSYLMMTMLNSLRGGVANISISLLMFLTMYFIMRLIVRLSVVPQATGRQL